MDTNKLTNTPIKLAPGVAREFGRKYKAAIKEHGLAHVANCELAKHFGLKEPETPKTRMSKAKKRFWAEKKKANADASAKGPKQKQNKESKTNGNKPT